MRKPASWMVRADERILEVLADDGNLTPKAISQEGKVPRAPVNRSHVSSRCNDLLRYGLIDEFDNNLYRITSTGEQFLAGELDAEQLEPLPWLVDDDEGG